MRSKNASHRPADTHFSPVNVRNCTKSPRSSRLRDQRRSCRIVRLLAFWGRARHGGNRSERTPAGSGRHRVFGADRRWRAVAARWLAKSICNGQKTVRSEDVAAWRQASAGPRRSRRAETSPRGSRARSPVSVRAGLGVAPFCGSIWPKVRRSGRSSPASWSVPLRLR